MLPQSYVILTLMPHSTISAINPSPSLRGSPINITPTFSNWGFSSKSMIGSSIS